MNENVGRNISNRENDMIDKKTMLGYRSITIIQNVLLVSQFVYNPPITAQNYYHLYYKT